MSIFVKRVFLPAFFSVIFLSIQLSAAEQPASSREYKKDINGSTVLIYSADISFCSNQSHLDDRTNSEKIQQTKGFNNDLMILFAPGKDLYFGGEFRYKKETSDYSGISFSASCGVIEAKKMYFIGGIGASRNRDESIKNFKQWSAFYFLKGVYSDSYFNLLYMNGKNSDNEGFDYLHKYDGFFQYSGDYLLASQNSLAICLKGAFSLYSAQVPSSYSNRGYDITDAIGYQNLGIIYRDFVLSGGVAVSLQNADSFIYGKSDSDETVYDHFSSGWCITFETSNIFQHISIAGEVLRFKGDYNTVSTKIKINSVW
jgi:hypothetical protein